MPLYRYYDVSPQDQSYKPNTPYHQPYSNKPYRRHYSDMSFQKPQKPNSSIFSQSSLPKNRQFNLRIDTNYQPHNASAPKLISKPNTIPNYQPYHSSALQPIAYHQSHDSPTPPPIPNTTTFPNHQTYNPPTPLNLTKTPIISNLQRYSDPLPQPNLTSRTSKFLNYQPYNLSTNYQFQHNPSITTTTNSIYKAYRPGIPLRNPYQDQYPQVGPYDQSDSASAYSEPDFEEYTPKCDIFFRGQEERNDRLMAEVKKLLEIAVDTNADKEGGGLGGMLASPSAGGGRGNREGCAAHGGYGRYAAYEEYDVDEGFVDDKTDDKIEGEESDGNDSGIFHC